MRLRRWRRACKLHAARLAVAQRRVPLGWDGGGGRDVTLMALLSFVLLGLGIEVEGEGSCEGELDLFDLVDGEGERTSAMS